MFLWIVLGILASVLALEDPYLSSHDTTDSAVDVETVINSGSVGVISLCIGERARNFAQLLLLSFIRNAHEPEVTLYLVTDDVDFFLETLEVEQVALSNGEAKIHFLSISAVKNYFLEDAEVTAANESSLVSTADHFPNVRSTILTVDSFGDLFQSTANTLTANIHMRVKLLKTRLFQLTPAMTALLLYVDSDIVIGAPLRPFLRIAISREKAILGEKGKSAVHGPLTSGDLATFPDIGVSSAPYHTGVMVMGRTESRVLLKEWSDEIASGKHRRDQWALDAVVQRMKGGVEVALMPTEGFFAFPNETVINGDVAFTFLHITLYRMALREKFGFTLEGMHKYYTQVLNLPFKYDFLDNDMRIMKAKFAEKAANANKKPKQKPKKHHYHRNKKHQR